MSIWALVNDETNVIDNVVVWDADTEWSAPTGFTLVNIDGKEVGIGFTYDATSGEFTAPPPPEPPVDTSGGAEPTVI